MTINEYLREGGRRKLLVVAVGVVVVVLAASITTGVVVGNKKRQSSSPVEEVDSELIIDVVSRYPPTAQPVLPSIIIKAPTGAQEEDENEDEDTTKKPSQAPQTDTDNEDEDSTKQPTASEEKDRYLPHILMVIMDDLGSGDLGIHGSGITTDVADELAKDGHFLNNFYVLPTCTTTRTALMTGRLPYQMGLYDVFQGGTGMPADEETLAQVLRKVGYRTHAVGKWHLGESQYKYLPTFRGFQSFYGFAGGGSANYFNHVNLRDAYVMRYDKEEFCGKGCAQFPDDRNYYSSFVFAREASRVVLNHKNKDEPLFLYLAFQSVQ